GEKGRPLSTLNNSLYMTCPAIVKSGDLIPIGDPSFAPVDKDIPIVELNERQAIMIDAEAFLGRARDHARFQVTSGVSYRYGRQLRVSAREPEVEDIINKSPKNVVRRDDKEVVFTTDIPSKYLAKLYRMDSLKIEEDERRFIFYFETDGSLKPREVLNYALERLVTRLNSIVEKVPGE
ncbi:MAG: DNA-directed RNA polymerase subunit D, partial [Thermoplasmatales archaeon]